MTSSENANLSNSIDGEKIPIPDQRAIADEFIQLTDLLNNHRLMGRKVVVGLGLGFVGAAASAVISAAENDEHEPLYTVVGIDLPSPEGYWKISKIQRGLSPFPSPDPNLPALIHQAVFQRQIFSQQFLKNLLNSLMSSWWTSL
jgi:hypothetical protein